MSNKPWNFNINNKIKPISIGDLNLSNKRTERDSRRQIGKSEKNKVWDRQRGKCKLCHQPLSPSATHYDHIKPYSEKGETNTTNIQALCANCHAKKTNEDRVKKISARKNKGSKPPSVSDLLWGNKNKKGPSLF